MLCQYCNVCLTEHKAGVPPQSVSQAPQARVQRKGPPEGTPPYTAIPYEAWWPALPSSQPPPPGVHGPWGQPQPPSSQPPPPGEEGPWGQPQHIVRPAGPALGSLVAPGAVEPSAWTPPLSQAQSSSPAPSGKNKGINRSLKHLFLKGLYNHSSLECLVLGSIYNQ